MNDDSEMKELKKIELKFMLESIAKLRQRAMDTRSKEDFDALMDLYSLLGNHADSFYNAIEVGNIDEGIIYEEDDNDIERVA